MQSPDIQFSLPSGAAATVAHQGAQLLSWKTADGIERLYVSPKVIRDGNSPIRSGVPICFPQFNMRVLGDKPLPKHGFARSVPWQVLRHTQNANEAKLVMGLNHLSAQRCDWPHAFEAQSTITLRDDGLRINFALRNTGAQAFEFAIAIHSYFSLADRAQTTLLGLENAPYTEFAKGGSTTSADREGLKFTTETDRVYAHAPKVTQLQDGARILRIEQSTSLPDTVVWNPGAELCATLADMPVDGYKHMLCVEAAAIEEPIRLQPNQSWNGWQRFAVQ